MAKHGALKGILFDFDGTLVDLATDYRGLRRSVGALIARHGVRLAEGPLLDTLVESALPNSAMKRAYRLIDRFEWDNRTLARSVPGSLALCRRAVEADYSLAIVSNNGRRVIEWCLDRFGFPRADVVVARGDAERPKPNPAVAALALRKLELGPGEVLIVGDSPVDASLGNAAGIGVWIVPRRPLAERNRSLSKLYSRLDLGRR